MENLKFIITTIIILAVLVVLGLWAFGTLETGDAHVNKQRQKELEDKNKELEEEITRLQDKLAELQPQEEVKEEVVEETTKEEQPKTTETPTTYKYQTLISELEKLIKDNIYMKEKSRGTRVGTLQNFLNLYNNTSNRVDNDYGKSTKTAVADFQKDVGLTADGEAGPSTFQKMIDWLKKQG